MRFSCIVVLKKVLLVDGFVCLKYSRSIFVVFGLASFVFSVSSVVDPVPLVVFPVPCLLLAAVGPVHVVVVHIPVCGVPPFLACCLWWWLLSLWWWHSFLIALFASPALSDASILL